MSPKQSGSIKHQGSFREQGLTRIELRAGSSIALIYAFRMLGLFMILPVFALYAEHIAGVTPFLLGLALGIYGLTQGLLQIPFGMLSDKIGRKPVIATGLVIFAIGSVIAAEAETIQGIITGRAIQGAGAIAAALMALAADLSREEHRIKIMGMIGVNIGVAFAVAMVLGPLINNWGGIKGIFYFTAILALLGIVVLFSLVPRPEQLKFHRDTQLVPSDISRIFQDKQLLRLDLGIFILHGVLMAIFVAVPQMLQSIGLPPDQHGWLYLPVFLISILIMVPLIILAEAKRRMKQVFVSCIGSLALALIILANASSVLGVAIALVVFFAAFNLLEASLPSLIAKTAPPDRKGTAMGVYSSSQFLGAFTGGSLGGWAYGQGGTEMLFTLCVSAILVWFLAAVSMKSPRYLSTYLLNVGKIEESDRQSLIAELVSIRGVAEAVVIAEDGIAYLKIDKHALDTDALMKYTQND